MIKMSNVFIFINYCKVKFVVVIALLYSSKILSQTTRETISNYIYHTINVLDDYEVDYLTDVEKKAIKELLSQRHFQIVDSFDINGDGYWDYLVNEGGVIFISKDSLMFSRYESYYRHNEETHYQMARYDNGNLVKYSFDENLNTIDSSYYEWKFETLLEKFNTKRKKIKFDFIQIIDDGCYGCDFYRLGLNSTGELIFYKWLKDKEYYIDYTVKLSKKDFKKFTSFVSWLIQTDLPNRINSGAVDAGNFTMRVVQNCDTIYDVRLYNGNSDYFALRFLENEVYNLFSSYRKDPPPKKEKKTIVYDPIPRNYTVGWWTAEDNVESALADLLFINTQKVWKLKLYDDFCSMEKLGDFQGESLIKHDRKTYYYIREEVDCEIGFEEDTLWTRYGLVCSSLLEDPVGQALSKDNLIGNWEVIHTRTAYTGELDLFTGFWNGILRISSDYSVFKLDKSGLFEVDLKYSLRGEYLMDEKSGYSYILPYFIDVNHLLIFLGETDFIYLKRKD